MLRQLRVENYRSLRNIRLELGRLTVVVGPNGSGKSNLYQALALARAAAEGRFRTSVLDQGGMPSALWAGPRKKGPVHMTLSIQVDDLTYALTAGLAPKDHKASRFVLDPEIKEETLHVGLPTKRSNRVLDRGVSAATLTDIDGASVMTTSLDPGESVLAQLRDGQRLPELADLQRRLAAWRFYHHFGTGPAAPARTPRPGVRTSVVSADGSDVAAAVVTLEERGDAALLHEAITAAFPGHRLRITSEQAGVFALTLQADGLSRPLSGRELSDGQLRFICLATALLTTRPPELLVLNEPENSLHPDGVRALAPLIAEAAAHCQVWVTTHDETLRRLLAPQATTIQLSIDGGETRVHEA